MQTLGEMRRAGGHWKAILNPIDERDELQVAFSFGLGIEDR